MGEAERTVLPGTTPFAIRVEPAADSMRRVVVEGELDLRTAPQLEAVLDRAIERGQGLLLDLSRVQFIDSTSLHTILLALERSRFADSRLAICADLPDHARRLFELVGVLEQLPLED